MLQKISWSSLLSFLFVLAALYYPVVLILYYRKDFQQAAWKPGAKKPEPLVDPLKENSAINAIPNPSSRMEYADFVLNEENRTVERPLPDHNHINEIVHELVDELKAVFDDLKGNRLSKESLCDYLKPVLGKYDVLKNSSLISEINTHLTEECENNCSIILTEAEIMRLWKG